MKRLAIAFALLGFSVSIAVSTVSAQDVNSEIEVGRAVVAAERKLIVAQNVGLSKEEGEAFWPLYNEYQEEVRRVNDRKVKLIQSYADEYEMLTDERAIEMLKEITSIREAELKLRKKYIKKFQKELPAKLVVRYFQVESKLDAIVQFDLARKIPLVE